MTQFSEVSGSDLLTEDYIWDIANSTKMGEYLTKKELKFINDFLDKNKRNISVCLDVACGSGRFSIPISQHGINVAAVDIDLIPLRKLIGVSREITVIRGDANRLPFKDSSFDCVFSIETIDYLDAINLLKEYKRVLKDNGFLIITTANRYSYKRYIHLFLSRHRIFYRNSFREMRLYLEGDSFKILNCLGYNWLPFKRASNNIFIILFEFLENILQLGRLIGVSPWVIIAAKKTVSTNEDSSRY